MGTINEESSWSPDGRTIAFDSIRSGKLNIYAWRIDTRELKRLTRIESNDFTPEWSPDGKEIARDKGINTYPSFSPEGGQILLRKVLGEKNSEVFVMNGVDRRCEI